MYIKGTPLLLIMPLTTRVHETSREPEPTRESLAKTGRGIYYMVA